MSARITVDNEGVPFEPWKKSENEENEERGDPVEGGTNVRVAKRTWIIVRKVGGICRRIMRSAIVSARGADARTVAGKEIARLSCTPGALEALTSMRR